MGLCIAWRYFSERWRSELAEGSSRPPSLPSGARAPDGAVPALAAGEAGVDPPDPDPPEPEFESSAQTSTAAIRAIRSESPTLAARERASSASIP